MTSLLLDTHVFLWARSETARLGKTTREAIDQAETVYVSIASAWEVAIKVSVGRLRFDDDFERCINDSGFTALGILFRHTDRVATLPLHHRDPFDRMLVAQAMVEGLTLVTEDRRLAAYGVPVLAAAT